MQRVGQVHDYDQWAADANRGQNARLATAAPTAPPHAHAPQGNARIDNDQHHTYQYIPQYDNRNRLPHQYHGWASNNRDATYWSGTHNNHHGWYNGYPLNDPYSHHHNWYGRTTRQVMADNVSQAWQNGIYGAGPRRGQEMVPRNPRDDQQFWVRELDGTCTLRHYNTIENDLRPGYWTVSGHGAAYFVRTRD